MCTKLANKLWHLTDQIDPNWRSPNPETSKVWSIECEGLLEMVTKNNMSPEGWINQREDDKKKIAHW